MPLRRLLPATALAVLALAAPAAASDGSYTAMVCANPDTGIGVAPRDGMFPDGVSQFAADTVPMTSLVGRQQCSGTITGGRGLLISPNGGTTLPQHAGAGFRYTLPDELDFLGATIYARTVTTNGLIAKVVRTSNDWMYAQPHFLMCEYGWNCFGTGSSFDPFGAANQIPIDTAHDGMPQGFKWFLRCTFPTCGVSEANAFNVYGGKVAVGDRRGPSAGSAAGDLATDATLRGTEALTFTAADGESGVYRARAIVDGRPQPWTAVTPGSASCRDVNPANADAYEFAVRVPCPRSTSGELQLDTRAFADGEHALRVVVEDAAGNAVTVVHRDHVTVDNVAPPEALTAPSLRGTARVGSTLVATAGSWSNGGAAGDPDVVRSWQRCRRDGTQCTSIPGAHDDLYEPTDADVGRRLRVVETATNVEGSATGTSTQTDQVRTLTGTLPPTDDGADNDCDGQVDEPNEPGTCPAPGDDGDRPSGAGAVPLPATKVVTPPPPAPVTSSARSASSPLNGDGASPAAKLTAKLARPVLDYGRTTSVTGRLTDEQGRAIRNAIVDVVATPELRGAKAAAAAPVVTNADGEFAAPVAGQGGTRTITFAYRYQREGAIVARADLRLVVRARVRFGVRLRGVVATYTGRVLAGAMPKGGKLVIVQGRAKGGAWQTFASRRAAKNGTFKGRYRLKVRRPGKRLQFRVRVLGESGWNYRGATSAAVTRTVR
jgi:hypothetical protein